MLGCREKSMAITEEDLRRSIHELDRRIERFDEMEEKLRQREAALLDEATVQAILFAILTKVRGRLSAQERNDILFAREHVLDGQSLRPKLERLLADTFQEAEYRKKAQG
jgi:uncharacterized sporulation protein YeaH/YhbH (DUF444 family)